MYDYDNMIKWHLLDYKLYFVSLPREINVWHVYGELGEMLHCSLKSPCRLQVASKFMPVSSLIIGESNV